jgi:ABC-type Fe3+-hydroxamate transport system substrate-binding protein
MSRLAELVGSTEAARPMIDAANIALGEADTARQGSRPLRVFCPIWRDPWMTIGPDTYVHDLLDRCGAANIFADSDERYPRVQLDEVASRRPDVILLPDEPYNFTSKHVSEFEPYGEVPAVSRNRIYLLEGRRLTWYGCRTAEGMGYVRRLLWGDGTGATDL